MIVVICVVVDESKCLDTPILEFSIICEHLPFLLGYKQILRLQLVNRNPGNPEMVPMRHQFNTIGGTEMADVEWTQKKWFHSSRVNFRFVSMSASWFMVSMYLIWILGSKLILSNNQSRATLWLPETCLSVWLLPCMIILITASLSSKIFIRASWLEEWTFEERKSTLSRSSFHEISFTFEVCEVLHEPGSCTGFLSVKNCDDQSP